MQSKSEDRSGGAESLQPRYAQTIEESDSRFNKRSGVFYPTGYALIAFPDQGKLHQAVTALAKGGIPDHDITLLRPEQMHDLAGQSQRDAGVLARIVSSELKQMQVLAQLADVGNHFALVKNSDQSSAALLHRIGHEFGASKGLLFHTLAIEELPVPRETIPGDSPFGVNEVIRSQETDADSSGKISDTDNSRNRSDTANGGKSRE